MIVSKETDETIRLKIEVETEELEELFVALLCSRKTDRQKELLRDLASEFEAIVPNLRKIRPEEKPAKTNDAGKAGKAGKGGAAATQPGKPTDLDLVKK